MSLTAREAREKGSDAPPRINAPLLHHAVGGPPVTGPLDPRTEQAAVPKGEMQADTDVHRRRPIPRYCSYGFWPAYRFTNMFYVISSTVVPSVRSWRGPGTPDKWLG